MRIRSLFLSFVVPLSLFLAAPGQTPAPAPPPAAAQTATDQISEPDRLMKQAEEALQKHDAPAARMLLDQVKALDPTHKNLAGLYAAMAYDRGDLAEAIRGYQQELAQHPDSFWVYTPMASAQIRTNHRDDAIASMRAWAAAVPDNPAAATALATLLLDGNDAAGAVAAAAAGIAALPEDKRNDPALQLLLGRAQIAAGNVDAGVATLSAQLNGSDQPLTLNNAAYELARTGKSLPLAESAERRAIFRLAAASRAWTLEDNLQNLRARTTLIFAAWDTLGYILYCEGKSDEALDFVRAAWTNSSHAEIGEHLGDVYDKLGKHQEALVTYQLALATIPPADAGSPGARRLRDKIDTQKKAGARADKLDAAAALTRLRTISLGPAGDHQGGAEYMLLLSRDRVEKLKPTGDKSVTGDADLLKKADVSHFTPIAYDLRIVKPAMLSCHATCELVFEP